MDRALASEAKSVGSNPALPTGAYGYCSTGFVPAGVSAGHLAARTLPGPEGAVGVVESALPHGIVWQAASSLKLLRAPRGG
jgi:hypothetical protein